MNTDFDHADLTRTCTRKKAYATEEVARVVVRRIQRANPGIEVRPYVCRRCGGWHVGGVPLADRTFAGPPEDALDPDSFEAVRARRSHGAPLFGRRRAYGEVGRPRRSDREAPRDREDTYD